MKIYNHKKCNKSNQKQLLLVTFCNTPAGIEVSFRTHGRTEAEGQTDMKVEIVI